MMVQLTRQTRPPVMTLMTLIHLRTVIIDVEDATLPKSIFVGLIHIQLFLSSIK